MIKSVRLGMIGLVSVRQDLVAKGQSTSRHIKSCLGKPGQAVVGWAMVAKSHLFGPAMVCLVAPRYAAVCLVLVAKNQYGVCLVLLRRAETCCGGQEPISGQAR